MDTPKHPMAAWREQKRREGYREITLCVKAEHKHLAEDLAAERHETVSEVFVAGLLALCEKEPARDHRMKQDYRLVQRLVDAYMAATYPTLLKAEAVETAETAEVPDRSYGWAPRAMAKVAAQLKTFSNAQMARAIGVNASTTHAVLKLWKKKGLVTQQEKGYLYQWRGEGDGAEEPV